MKTRRSTFLFGRCQAAACCSLSVMWVVEAKIISIVMSPSPLPALDSMRASKGPQFTEPFSTMHKRKQLYKPDLLWATTIVTSKRLLGCGVHLCRALSLMVQCTAVCFLSAQFATRRPTEQFFSENVSFRQRRICKTPVQSCKECVILFWTAVKVPEHKSRVRHSLAILCSCRKSLCNSLRKHHPSCTSCCASSVLAELDDASIKCRAGSYRRDVYPCTCRYCA